MKINGVAKLKFLLQTSSLYGNEKLLDYLLNNTDYVWSVDEVKIAFENVIKTDKVKPVEVVKNYSKTRNLEEIEEVAEIRTRNVAKLSKAQKSNFTKHKYFKKEMIESLGWE